MTSDLNAMLVQIDEHRARLGQLGNTLDLLDYEPTATQVDRDKLIQQRVELRGKIADLYAAIDDEIRVNGQQAPERWRAMVATDQSTTAREWHPSDIAVWRGRQVVVLTPLGAQTILLPSGQEKSVFPDELQELPSRATTQTGREDGPTA